jgi:hypothetical protein
LGRRPSFLRVLPSSGYDQRQTTENDRPRHDSDEMTRR